jgi:hypothetical protein
MINIGSATVSLQPAADYVVNHHEFDQSAAMGVHDLPEDYKGVLTEVRKAFKKEGVPFDQDVVTDGEVEFSRFSSIESRSSTRNQLTEQPMEPKELEKRLKRAASTGFISYRYG